MANQIYFDPYTGSPVNFTGPSQPAIQPISAGVTQPTIQPTSGSMGSATGAPGGDYGASAAQSGTSPYTGFAGSQGYAPGALMDMIYSNPWYILPDVFQGIDMTSPGYQYLRDFGGDPLGLYNILAGSDRTLGDGDDNNFVNFMAELYRNLGTPGGSGFNAKDMISRIFNADKDNSTLGSILSMGNGSQQVRTLFNMLRDVSNVGMNPLAASGYQSAVARAGDRYGNQALKTEAGDLQGPREWIKQNMPWLTT